MAPTALNGHYNLGDAENARVLETRGGSRGKRCVGRANDQTMRTRTPRAGRVVTFPKGAAYRRHRGPCHAARATVASSDSTP